MATESLPQRTPEGRRRPELEPRRGLRLGRYELLAPLASGGMAEVWIARLAAEHGFERLVAIKTIRAEYADSDVFRRMFLDEARLAARIAHANVVEVLDLGEEQGIVYQTMALVEGESVQGLLVRRKGLGARGLPCGIAARIVADALSGLHAAHELTDADGHSLHLVHRDVSPQNILVGVDGVAKIADFGVAKARSRLADETDAGQLKGKFAYMAPEQLARGPVDRRADIFAAGIILWEALTGERLFGGGDLLETIEKLRDAVVPDPREVAPSVPPPLARVTRRALAREPAARFATAAEMSDALERALRASEMPLPATTKQVGALVADLCADELHRRREAVRDAVRDTPSGRGAVAPAWVKPTALEMAPTVPRFASASARATATFWRHRTAMGVAAGVLVTATLAFLVLPRPGANAAPINARVEESAAAAGSFGSQATPPAEPAGTAATAAAPVVSTASSSSPTAWSAPAATHAKLPRTHAPATPPRVKYGNPYGP
jgi:serine/threonine-protein kinase